MRGVHCQARSIWPCQGGGWCQHRPARSATRLAPSPSFEDQISPPTRASLSQQHMTHHSMKNSDKDFKIRVFLATLYTFWSHWRTGTFDWVVGTVGVVRTRVLQRQLVEAIFVSKIVIFGLEIVILGAFFQILMISRFFGANQSLTIGFPDFFSRFSRFQISNFRSRES